jgi:NAD(P)-dependent dehydrogenase (short-subunit alcohol dehydrogenase family)
MARVFVTGARRAIGRATVIELVRRGHQVIGGVRSTDHFEDLKALGVDSAGEVEAVLLELTSPSSIAAAASEVIAGGVLDVVINNAAILPVARSSSVTHRSSGSRLRRMSSARCCSPRQSFLRCGLRAMGSS